MSVSLGHCWLDGSTVNTVRVLLALLDSRWGLNFHGEGLKAKTEGLWGVERGLSGRSEAGLLGALSEVEGVLARGGVLVEGAAGVLMAEQGLRFNILNR